MKVNKAKRYNISMTPDTQERALQWGLQEHIPGGLSGVLTTLIWQHCHVKNGVLKDQTNLFDPAFQKGKKK